MTANAFSIVHLSCLHMEPALLVRVLAYVGGDDAQAQELWRVSRLVCRLLEEEVVESVVLEVPPSECEGHGEVGVPRGVVASIARVMPRVHTIRVRKSVQHQMQISSSSNSANANAHRRPTSPMALRAGYAFIHALGDQLLAHPLSQITHLDLQNADIGYIGMSRLVCLLGGRDGGRQSSYSPQNSDRANSKSSNYPLPLPNLRECNVANNVMGADAMTLLARSFEPPATTATTPESTPHWWTAHLFRLNVSDNAITDDGFCALARSLPHLPSLRQLLTRNNWLSERGMECFAANMKHQPALEELDVSWNPEIGSAGVRKLCGALALHCVHLRVLHMSGVGAGVEGCAALATALGALPRLHDLHIAGNGLDSRDVEVLVQQFVLVPHLRLLDLSRNAIGDAGMRSLSAQFCCIPKLEALHLSDCGVTCDGLDSASLHCFHLPRLSHLDVSQNALGPRGLMPLSRCVEQFPALVELNVNRCFDPLVQLLDTAHVSKCAQVLSRAPRLRKIQCEGFGGKEVRVLADVAALAVRRVSWMQVIASTTNGAEPSSSIRGVEFYV